MTLGTVLYAIGEKLGAFGSLARVLFDLAWSLLTFFVVPVIVLEEARGLRSLFRESGAAFRETWGESVSATLGISFVYLPVALVGLGGLGWACFLGSGTAAYLVGMVARTVLYRYAADGERFGPCVGQNPDTIFSAE